MEGRRNNSKKRRVILEALRSTTAHPTAEMIYNTVKQEIPDLSLGTVYRNLAIFEEEGSVINICTVDGQARYDARTDTHAHFVCRGCHSVSDIEIGDEVSQLYTSIEENYSCLPDSAALLFYGTCADCRGDQ